MTSTLMSRPLKNVNCVYRPGVACGIRKENSYLNPDDTNNQKRRIIGVIWVQGTNESLSNGACCGIPQFYVASINYSSPNGFSFHTAVQLFSVYSRLRRDNERLTVDTK